MDTPHWEIFASDELREQGYPEKKRNKIMGKVMKQSVRSLHDIFKWGNGGPFDKRNRIEFEGILEKWRLLRYWETLADMRKRLSGVTFIDQESER